MSKTDKVTFEFVDLLPKELREGVVYISLEHRTVVHLCCSGCGERVVLGLSPAQWKLIFDGETISFSPSIGNGELTCNSHYWIRENRIVWATPLTARQTQESQLSDRADAIAHYEQSAVSQSRGWKFMKRLWRRRSR